MSDYLEKKCVNLGIKLVFTYNKATVLSAEIRNETPLLVADMLFKNCPETVAHAILGFFTDIEHKYSYENIIRDYAKQFLKPYTSNIKHLDLSYLVNPKQSIDVDYNINFNMDNPDIYNVDVNDPHLVELDISSMDAKNFWGSEIQYRSNTSLKPLKDDELELNIVVLPPST